MIAQMAATAGSVAVGSTIGHGISSMLFGGTSTTPESQAPPQPASQASQFAGSCDVQAKGIMSTSNIYSSYDSSYFPCKTSQSVLRPLTLIHAVGILNNSRQ